MLALEMAGLKPEDVWFCGDDLQCDIFGADACGIFPVWYTGACEAAITGRPHPGIQVAQWETLRAVLEAL